MPPDAISDHVLPIDVAKSLHYSRCRYRVMVVLRDHGPQYPAELARKARVDLRTLRWLMVGNPPRYRRERALLELGLVQELRGPDGRFFDLTPKGASVAMLLVGPAGTVVPAPREHDGSR